MTFKSIYILIKSVSHCVDFHLYHHCFFMAIYNKYGDCIETTLNIVLFIKVISIEMCSSFMNKSLKLGEQRKTMTQYHMNNLILMTQTWMY